MSNRDFAKSFGYGFRNKPPVKFVKAGNELKASKEHRSLASAGAEVSGLYRLLHSSEATKHVQLQTPSENCTICGLEIKTSLKEHVLSTAHLTSLEHQRAPLNPLHISTTSFGFRHLETLGWTPLQEHGLGMDGHHGPREPIKASRVKNDTIGLGVKIKPARRKHVQTILSKREIIKRYKREVEKRKALLEYMHRV